MKLMMMMMKQSNLSRILVTRFMSASDEVNVTYFPTAEYPPFGTDRIAVSCGAGGEA